jgi:hypothetical protein
MSRASYARRLLVAIGVALVGCQYVSGLSSLEAGAGGGDAGLSCGYDGGTCQAGAGMCPMCTGNVCTPTCSKANCPNQTIVAGMGPTAMQCTDTTCAGKTFTCSGEYLCELDCLEQGSCAGTVLVCGDGPCRMNCAVGMACGMGTAMQGTAMQCGKNSCDGTYFAPSGAMSPIMQSDCSQACGCTLINTMK